MSALPKQTRSCEANGGRNSMVFGKIKAGLTLSAINECEVLAKSLSSSDSDCSPSVRHADQQKSSTQISQCTTRCSLRSMNTNSSLRSMTNLTLLSDDHAVPVKLSGRFQPQDIDNDSDDTQSNISGRDCSDTSWSISASPTSLARCSGSVHGSMISNATCCYVSCVGSETQTVVTDFASCVQMSRDINENTPTSFEHRLAEMDFFASCVCESQEKWERRMMEKLQKRVLSRVEKKGLSPSERNFSKALRFVMKKRTMEFNAERPPKMSYVFAPSFPTIELPSNAMARRRRNGAKSFLRSATGMLTGSQLYKRVFSQRLSRSTAALPTTSWENESPSDQESS